MLVWVHPEAEPELRIQVQIVYLGGKGNTVAGRGKERRPPVKGTIAGWYWLWVMGS